MHSSDLSIHQGVMEEEKQRTIWHITLKYGQQSSLNVPASEGFTSVALFWKHVFNLNLTYTISYQEKTPTFDFWLFSSPSSNLSCPPSFLGKMKLYILFPRGCPGSLRACTL